MTDFIAWCFSIKRPFHINFIAVTIATILTGIVVISSIALVVAGYWIIPVLFWILLPIYYLVSSYLKDQNND